MIEASRLLFDPLIAWPWFWALAALGAAALVFYGLSRGRAPVTRALGLIVVLAAISNPSLVQEEREPLPSVVGMVVDRSDSMSFGDRNEIANEAFEELRSKMDAEDGLDLRVIEVETTGDGTRLIGALEGMLADVPRDRIAGSILITDGQVLDLPEVLSA